MVVGDGVVVEADAVELLEKGLNGFLYFRIVVRGDVEDTAFMIGSKLVVFNDKLAILDDIAGRAEHLFLIFVFFVEGEICIRPDPKMTLMLEAKRPCRSRAGDDGNLLQRILAG